MEMVPGPLCGSDDIIAPIESNPGTDIPRNCDERHWIGPTYAKSRLFRKCIDRHSPLVGN